MNRLTRRGVLTGVAAASAASMTPLVAPTPASAAAPPAGKQNAGWYRYKVGDFEVTVVTDGVTNTPLNDAYVANAPKDTVNTALAGDFMQRDRAFHVYTPIVINTGSKLVAIDTGLGLGTFEQSKGAAGQYHTNLKAAGIDPSTVDTVIISHFHGDHINGLIGPENKPAFPNAEIIVPAAEWVFWTNESNASRVPEQIRGTFGNVKRVFGIVTKVTQHEPNKELVPGIMAIPSPGHTPGHTSHVVTSGNEKLLVQADITAGVATLFIRNPEWQAWFDSDKETAVQTRKRLYDMAAAERIRVQGFHFPFPGVGYIEKSGSGYRLIPAQWNTSL
jgi:glyoxylase-like metal-dependent hydrolase (beta-lactamase superfamily II)